MGGVVGGGENFTEIPVETVSTSNCLLLVRCVLAVTYLLTILCLSSVKGTSQHQILSLSSRRVALDLIFLFKIVNGLVDCPELLRHIDLHVPAATHLLQPFSRHSHRTVYVYQSVIPRLLRLRNAAHQLEFFGVSMLVFRRGVFSWVSEHGGH
ncbi:hypothetical protein J6590_047404 [Homalodisca vitripennis]|nr:hypothetical protein J6590_047404 [Homalodisca vitripennis]